MAHFIRDIFAALAASPNTDQTALLASPYNMEQAPGSVSEGWCYLNLFADTHVPQASRALGRYASWAAIHNYVYDVNHDRVGALYPGHLRLVIGTSSGVHKSNKLLFHLCRVPATDSLIRARDILDSSLLVSCTLGSNDAGDAVVTEHNVLPSPSNIHQALGSVPNPLVRRFMFNIGSIRSPATHRDPVYITIDPAGGPLSSFLYYNHYARYTSLLVRLQPSFTSLKCHTELHTAWHPATESAPKTAADFGNRPGHELHVMQSLFPGGRLDPVILPCVEGYGITMMVKPAPVFGGKPKLTIQAVFSFPPDNVAPSSSEMLSIWVEALVDATPFA
jgi:hypothetical protein